MHSNHEPKTQIVHFLVKDVRMCAYLKNVKKVLPLVALESVPGCPSYLAGLMNLKGKNIPVIDLAIRFGMNRHKKFTIDMPVLLCTNDQETEEEIAIIVDDVLGLTDFDETKLQIHKDFAKNDSPFLATIINDLDSSLLININCLLEINIIKDDN